MKRIKSERIPIIIYEPTLDEESEFLKSGVINDIDRFKSDSDMNLTNRFYSDILGDAEDKVYTRDLFRRDKCRFFTIDFVKSLSSFLQFKYQTTTTPTIYW